MSAQFRYWDKNFITFPRKWAGFQNFSESLNTLHCFINKTRWETEQFWYRDKNFITFPTRCASFQKCSESLCRGVPKRLLQKLNWEKKYILIFEKGLLWAWNLLYLMRPRKEDNNSNLIALSFQKSKGKKKFLSISTKKW